MTRWSAANQGRQKRGNTFYGKYDTSTLSNVLLECFARFSKSIFDLPSTPFTPFHETNMCE